MAKRKGNVTKIGKSKYSYFILLDGDQFYFNTKFDPKCGVGDTVGIEFDQKAENRGQVKKVVVLNDSGSPKGYQDDGGGSSSGSSYSGGSGGGDKDRQVSIIWQSCQKVAAELVKTEVSAEACASKGNPDSKALEIKARFDTLTVALFEDACDPRTSVTYKEVKGIAADADGKPEGKPEPEDDFADATPDANDDWGDDDSSDW